MERVVAVTLDGIDTAYPYRVLAEKRVVYDTMAVVCAVQCIEGARTHPS